jgi:hypothetical protein
MNALELLKRFLQLPELATVGSTQERAAFIALRIDRRTVREVGQDVGVSKSQVTNLADLFQEKLATRMRELGRKPNAGSEEYRILSRVLYERLGELAEESGSEDWSSAQTIGTFKEFAVSREDVAEVTGSRLRDPDE